ncbi:putative peptidase [Pseudonocardia sp. Ae168_Ps1]|uniref:M23 family metallopeptidase n=1 Tax=unclassified Pseudonocardia TaxID=2619320 RepID=UPI000961D777|nr:MULTISPECIES: peptidoglycan DD-metalloendopeptidase family protein [unclassified Pseudonocardia]OLL74053.1 putative peptidase [Pseudonocardia sp. Ae150A_Ps1]OLL80030.1 putative peptidase [Pseudonocardia sp. Ae168_Ps1]OLL85838.1 putative peptidase [Pseudonocardia sp. Ae263_Ps1]OLL94132.1 putative peptidase [Pseudonocardia sp. Ae356_Ps1]
MPVTAGGHRHPAPPPSVTRTRVPTGADVHRPHPPAHVPARTRPEPAGTRHRPGTAAPRNRPQGPRDGHRPAAPARPGTPDAPVARAAAPHPGPAATARTAAPGGAVRATSHDGTVRGAATPTTGAARPATAGGHQFPLPPATGHRTRVTVAAAAGGALVAAGQTMAGALGFPGLSGEQAVEDSYARLAASAMLPVSAEPRPADTTAPAVTSAIGGEQLASQASLPDLDDTTEVDVASLTKAARLGEQAATQERAISGAMSHGAPKAVVFDGEPLVMPTAGRFTSGFGARWGVQHYGIDLAAPIGTPIFALTDGVVEKAGPASGFGMWVVLKHPDGTSSVYGHIHRSLVEVGQQVKAGDEIAEVGNRGQSTGPHLHLEIWESDGSKTNPLPWLTERGLDVTRLTGDRDA